MRRLGIVSLAVALMVGGPALAQPAGEKPGEGVICLWGVVSAMAEVGERCFAGEDPDFQRELRSAVGRVDAYVTRNGKFTPSDVAKFKREQARVGAPHDQLCRGDAVEMYRIIHKGGAPKLRSLVDKATAHDGAPTWGTCF